MSLKCFIFKKYCLSKFTDKLCVPIPKVETLKLLNTSQKHDYNYEISKNWNYPPKKMRKRFLLLLCSDCLYIGNLARKRFPNKFIKNSYNLKPINFINTAWIQIALKTFWNWFDKKETVKQGAV